MNQMRSCSIDSVPKQSVESSEAQRIMYFKITNKKVLLRERKRHTARKRAQDADPPPPAGPDPPPLAGLTFDLTPPLPGWIDL